MVKVDTVAFQDPSIEVLKVVGWLNPVGPSRKKRFVCKVRVTFSDGLQKIAVALVDTGSEVNLIGEHFLAHVHRKSARKPVSLEGAGGHRLDGGKDGCHLQLNFTKQSLFNPSLVSEVKAKCWFYRAAIKYDLFLGMPFHALTGFSPLVNRGCFVQDKNILSAHNQPTSKIRDRDSLSLFWPGSLSLQDFVRKKVQISDVSELTPEPPLLTPSKIKVLNHGGNGNQSATGLLITW